MTVPHYCLVCHSPIQARHESSHQVGLVHFSQIFDLFLLLSFFFPSIFSPATHTPSAWSMSVHSPIPFALPIRVKTTPRLSTNYYFTFCSYVPCLQTTSVTDPNPQLLYFAAPIRNPCEFPLSPSSPCSGSQGNSAWAVMSGHILTPLCRHRLRAGLLSLVLTA